MQSEEKKKHAFRRALDYIWYTTDTVSIPFGLGFPYLTRPMQSWGTQGLGTPYLDQTNRRPALAQARGGDSNFSAGGWVLLIQ